jgi:hypothetical protein
MFYLRADFRDIGRFACHCPTPEYLDIVLESNGFACIHT